jgi:hypothetical protein
VVCSWLAIRPAGMDIMMDNETANATITRSDLTFRLDRFLIALLIIPIVFYSPKFSVIGGSQEEK